MNLVIDQGNTICKLALFETGDEPLEVIMCNDLTVNFLRDVLNQWRPDACILSSVKRLNKKLSEYLRAHVVNFLQLDSTTALPLRNAYKTPHTLGLDRIAAAVGAWSFQPGKPLLVIDMGTAITYDFVRKDGAYMGGNIAPGLQMRLSALHRFTDRLPLIEPSPVFEQMGLDTETAIRSGVMQGIVYEVEGYFNELQHMHPDLFAFLTGGDLFYFDGKLKNTIFASKILVLIGLNRILNYNVHS
jgi:pantothenate kinase, type III